MINILNKTIQVNASVKMPAILFGTYKKITPDSIQQALHNGFFSFDMAAVYKTEDLLLSEIDRYCKNNNLKSCRDKFYFLYKLDATKLQPEQVHLQTDLILEKIARVFPESAPYIDALVIHAPNHSVPIEQTWHAMEQLIAEGKAKSIGVSNFNVRHLECMQELNLSLPSINQIELNPFFAQKDLVDYCNENKIKISSYRSWNNKGSLNDIKLLSDISSQLGMSVMQVINSWKFTKGMQIVSISQNPEHIAELADVVVLDDKYMQILDKLDLGENGRTCSGAWSSFDFNGANWNPLNTQQQILEQIDNNVFIKNLGKKAYETFVKTKNGKNHKGDQLSSFEDMPIHTQNGWIAFAYAVIELNAPAETAWDNYYKVASGELTCSGQKHEWPYSRLLLENQNAAEAILDAANSVRTVSALNTIARPQI